MAETTDESQDALKQELASVDFSTFVLSLATQALCSLGLAEHPETGKCQIDMNLARQFIDILGMLQTKTSGNLTPDEDRLLSTLLFDLRLKYVDACKARSEQG